MKFVSLVAMYGEKPPLLAELLAQCQARLVEHLGSAFQPYTLGQIHATVVSLQMVENSDQVNLFMLRYRGVKARMNFDHMLSFLRNGADLPLCIQIGGYARGASPFLSRGRTPYERSFQLHQGIAVLMGWPCRTSSDVRRSESPSTYFTSIKAFAELRLSLENFNVMHAYNDTSSEPDNDFYLRLGLLAEPQLPQSRVRRVEEAMRAFLATCSPTTFQVGAQDLSIVASDREVYTPDATVVLPLLDPKLTAESLSKLYSAAR